jgi:DNA-binding CsgD family transcriptional regulator
MTSGSGEERVLLQVLDDLALPIFIIDPELMVLESNAAARELLTEGRGLSIISGQLRFARNDQQDAFIRGVGRAIAFPSVSPTAYGVEVGDGIEAALHLCIRPLVGGQGVARGSRIAVYVVDCRQQTFLDTELLRRVYRFSPAEARVVQELLQGHSAETIAESLSISVYTVRTHLKNLFAKTGTKRQGELIAKIAASLGSLRVPSQNPPFEGCADSRNPLNSAAQPERTGARDASESDS